MAPALALAILSILCRPARAGRASASSLALAVVPATAALTALHRRVSGALLGEEITTAYADTTGHQPGHPAAALAARPGAVARRRRSCWFSATGGFVMSVLPVGLLVAPVVHLVGAAARRRASGGGCWCCSTARCWWPGGAPRPALVRGRALAERNILGHSRVEQLERRVEEVADVTRRDAGPQRRRGTPDRARPPRRRPGPDRRGRHERRPRREADRAPTPRPPPSCSARPARPRSRALEDLRSVVRGIHPPALADRGLAGGIEALALPIPLPVTVSVDVPPLPPPVESAAYFAVAECLANAVKHADASRAWVTVRARRRAAAARRRRRRPRRRRPGRQRSGRCRPAARGVRRHDGRRQPAGRADRRDHGGAVPDR